MGKYIPRLLLGVCIAAYIAFFGTYSVAKFHHLYSEYFDLGIMHQTVYNTYQGMKTGDLSRILELTDPHGTPMQIKRMAIHNDPALVLLAPFYFIHAGPETILVIQTVVLALGALAIYLIATKLVEDEWMALTFSFAYLMYSPMHWANIFDFHAVTIATTAILFMVYFWLSERFKLSLLCMVLALLTKEEVGLSIGVFGLYVALDTWNMKKDVPKWYTPAITVISWGWSLLSTFVIIPAFNNGKHFASGYYDNLLPNAAGRIFNRSTAHYFLNTLGPLLFLPLLAPAFLLIAVPELGINLLSSNEQLRDLGFHYFSAIQPWFFVGAIFGMKGLVEKRPKFARLVTIGLVISSLLFAYMNGPLPFTRNPNADALFYTRPGENAFSTEWASKLKDDGIKVSATEEVAPFFYITQIFLHLSSRNYVYADYVIISKGNLEYTYRKDEELPAYESLKNDTNFTKIYDNEGYEVYKKR